MARKREAAPPADQPVASAERAPGVLVGMDTWLTLGGKFAPVVVGVIGLGYLSGYVIVNVYLTVLGVRPPNLVASRYLATGVLYLVTSAVPLIMLIAFWRLSAETNDAWGKWKAGLIRWAVRLPGIVLAILVVAAFANFLTRSSPFTTTLGSDPRKFWLVCQILVLNTVLWTLGSSSAWPSRKKGYSDNGEDDKLINWFRMPFYVVMIPLALISSLVIFAVFVYPRVDAGYGGGAPTKVQLMLDATSPLVDVLPKSSKPGTTDSLDLIDQTDDGYIVSLDAGKEIVVVPRDAVRGVIATPRVVLPP